MNAEHRCAVYQFFAADDSLLYVGISVHPGKRFSQHERTKPWFSDVATIKVTYYPDRDQAYANEQMLIHTLHPRYTNFEDHPRFVAPYQTIVFGIVPKDPTHYMAKKTHCLRGHRFDSINTYISPKGYRACRECVRLRNEANKNHRKTLQL